MRLHLTFLFFFIVGNWAFCQLPDCQINNHTKNIKLTGNKIVEHIECELQINSAKGTNYAEIRIDYKKGNNIKELEASIYDITGNKIRTLKKKDITKANAFSYGQFHSDDMILSFKLIHNQYPYIIKYSYSEDINEYLYLAYWIPRRNKNIEVKKAQLQIEIPKNLNFRIIKTNIDSAKTEYLSTTDRHTWTIENVGYPEQESYGPRKAELFPKVIVIPEDYRYGIMGSTKTWQSYGNWNYRLKKGLDELSDAEKIKVKQLTEPLKTNKEKVNALYKYMQENTRYINVALDIGGLEPLSAESVCTNKYGDCKALCNYMHAILREAGINSVYTTIYADSKPVKINPEYPSQQFNHVILSVPLEKDTIWLECTDSTSPFNYLGTFTQNRTALLIQKDNSHLVQTPDLSPKEVANNYKSVVQIKPNGETILISSITMRGRSFDYLKGLDDGLPESKKINYLDEMNLFENADIHTYEIKRPHRDSTWLKLNLGATLNHIAEPIGKRLLLKPICPFSIDLEKPEKRNHEVIFNYPINISDSTLYQLPQALQSISGIQNQDITCNFGSYQRIITHNEKNLTIHRKILIKAGTYYLKDYPELYNFISTCSNNELQKAIITYKSN